MPPTRKLSYPGERRQSEEQGRREGNKQRKRKDAEIRTDLKNKIHFCVPQVMCSFLPRDIRPCCGRGVTKSFNRLAQIIIRSTSSSVLSSPVRLHIVEYLGVGCPAEQPPVASGNSSSSAIFRRGLPLSEKRGPREETRRFCNCPAHHRSRPRLENVFPIP